MLYPEFGGFEIEISEKPQVLKHLRILFDVEWYKLEY